MFVERLLLTLLFSGKPSRLFAFFKARATLRRSKLLWSLVFCFLFAPAIAQTPHIQGRFFERLVPANTIEAPVIVEEVEPRICHEREPSLHIVLFGAEEHIYEILCEGLEAAADLRWRDEATLPCNPSMIEGEVPDHRKISGEFLEWLFSDPGMARSIDRPRISIGCAQIVGDVDLSYREVAPVFWLWDSHFLGDLVFRQTRFQRTVNLYRSVVEGDLEGGSMELDGSLFLRGGAMFKGKVNLRGAKVAGNLEADGSTFEGEFDGDALEVGGSLFLRGGATFKDKVDLLGASVAGALIGDGSTFEGEFDGDGLEVGDSLFLRDGATFKDKVDLLGASVAGALVGDGSTFEGEFNGNRIVVGETLLLRGGAVFKGKVNLLLAKVAGNLEADGSTFEGEFDGDGLEVGGSLFLRGGATFKDKVDLLGAKVAGDVDAIGSTFEGEFSGSGLEIGDSLYLRGSAAFKDEIDLIAVQIGNHLQFGESTFLGLIDMTGAKVEDELLISSPERAHGFPMWGPKARLILRNVEVGALQAEMDAWRTKDDGWLSMDLTGFVYRRLGGLNAKLGGTKVNMADASAGDLIDWIERTQPDPDSRYDPQPYTQLADALARDGLLSKSKAIKLARAKHQLRADNVPLLTKAGLAFGLVTVGGGVYPSIAFIWFILLFVGGVYASSRSSAAELRSFGERCWYSLENSVPLMPLSNSFQDIDHKSSTVDGFFRAQKILGFILATVLVGALTLVES